MRREGVLLALWLAGLGGVVSPARADLVLPDEPAPLAEGARGSPALELSLGTAEGEGNGAIPWSRLDPVTYGLVRDVVGGALLVREVRDIAFRSRPEVFDYLIAHPDFAAEVARTLRKGKYRLHRVGDVYEADDGYGARGRVVLVFAQGGQRLFYLEGRYDPPLLPTMAGRLVVLLDSVHAVGIDGLTYCDMRVAGFLRLDTPFTEVAARLTRRLSEAEVDRRVRRFFRHVAAVSSRAYDDPEGLIDLLEQRSDLPEDRMAEFRGILVGHLLPAWAGRSGLRLLDAPLEPPSSSP